jgi:hypothetical protein
MCNACAFQCCASDEFERCGCDHCDEPDCWDEPEDLDGSDEAGIPDDEDYRLAACPCAPAPTRFRCEEIRPC